MQSADKTVKVVDLRRLSSQPDAHSQSWRSSLDARCELDNLSLRFDGSGLRLDDAEQANSRTEKRRRARDALPPSIDESALIGLKFWACLPVELGTQMLAERLADKEGVRGKS